MKATPTLIKALSLMTDGEERGGSDFGYEMDIRRDDGRPMKNPQAYGRWAGRYLAKMSSAGLVVETFNKSRYCSMYRITKEGREFLSNNCRSVSHE